MRHASLPNDSSRRDFLKQAGLGLSVLPFIGNLPSLGFENQSARKRRLVVIFSPNGVVPDTFWPQGSGTEFTLPESLSPLEPFRDQLLTLHGISEKVKGDGDNHMRGIGCLLTGIELFPGNIQGGSHTPAGWSMGHSIDQEIARHLQKSSATQTRFGSLEFGVMVPDRADTWTRMVYAGPNRPVAPIDDPYQMFKKLYGQKENQKHVASVLDEIHADLARVGGLVSKEDKQLLEDHAEFVREMERELQTNPQTVTHAVPKLDPGIAEENDNYPTLSKMQIELLISSFINDSARVATLQYAHSVSNARMTWLGIKEGHHSLSHNPDSDKESQEKLTQINKWYAEQVAHLAKRLSETPEPGSTGSMLDHTTIVWTNELGKGNSHTLDRIPFVMVGGGLGFKMGRALQFKNEPHNRLLVALANGMGHEIESFGKEDFCEKGALDSLL